VADLAIVADSEAIARLVSELGYPTSTSQMQRRLETILNYDDYLTVVACEGGEIVGFIGTRSGPSTRTRDFTVRSWPWPSRRTSSGVGSVEC
jgi:hypothetical protein